MVLSICFVQALLVVSWTIYGLFLPTFGQELGLTKSHISLLLVIDQMVFIAADWSAGVVADKILAQRRRIGPAILGASIVSGVLLMSMPRIAEDQARALFFAVALVWCVSSSALRAPTLSLLGKLGGVSRKSGVINGVLIAIGIAGALGPLLTASLQGVAPELPIAIATSALVVATLPLLKKQLNVSTGTVDAPRSERSELLSSWVPPLFVSAVAVQAFLSMQIPSTAASAQLGKAAPVAAFWIGFTVGSAIDRLAFKMELRSAAWRAAGCALAGAAVLCAVRTEGWGASTTAISCFGAAWGLVYIQSLRSAMAGAAQTLGRRVGLFFSVLATAAFARLAWQWASDGSALLPWFIPCALCLCGAIYLGVTTHLWLKKSPAS